MNEQNVKPWQKAQMENFRKREELTWEAHRLSQEAPDPELRERLENYRTKIPTKSTTAPKSTKAPAKPRTDSAATWKRVKRLYDAANDELLTKSIRQRYQVEGLQVR